MQGLKADVSKGMCTSDNQLTERDLRYDWMPRVHLAIQWLWFNWMDFIFKPGKISSKESEFGSTTSDAWLAPFDIHP